MLSVELDRYFFVLHTFHVSEEPNIFARHRVSSYKSAILQKRVISDTVVNGHYVQIVWKVEMNIFLVEYIKATLNFQFFQMQKKFKVVKVHCLGECDLAVRYAALGKKMRQ
jgi:hypothetical protein